MEQDVDIGCKNRIGYHVRFNIAPLIVHRHCVIDRLLFRLFVDGYVSTIGHAGGSRLNDYQVLPLAHIHRNSGDRNSGDRNSRNSGRDSIPISHLRLFLVPDTLGQAPYQQQSQDVQRSSCHPVACRFSNAAYITCVSSPYSAER
jgi:hypothetical protein